MTYNEKLLNFYNENRENEVLFGTAAEWRPPLFAPESKDTGGILFVGMNPSTGGLKEALERINGGEKRELTADEVAKLIGTQEAAYDNYSFFKGRRDSAKKCWEQKPIAHLDLYPFRMKGKQAEAIKKFESTETELCLASFCRDLFVQGFQAHRPALVWIANLGAYDDMLKNENSVWHEFLKCSRPDHVGLPRIHVGYLSVGGCDRPFICTPQLSGMPYYTIKNKWEVAYRKIRELIKTML